MSRRYPGMARITALALAAGVAAAALAAGERPRVGGVAKLEQDATASYETETRQLAVDDAVFFQDLLETGAGARLAVTLADDTSLTLGENASLRIDEFVYEPDTDSGKLDLSALKGAFLFVGGDTENMEESQVEIDTAVGTLGVRGTTVWGGQIDGSFGVLVAAGRVTVRNNAGEVRLGPGEGTQVESMDSAPSAPKKWPEEKVQRALATVSFPDN